MTPSDFVGIGSSVLTACVMGAGNIIMARKNQKDSVQLLITEAKTDAQETIELRTVTSGISELNSSVKALSAAFHNHEITCAGDKAAMKIQIKDCSDDVKEVLLSQQQMQRQITNLALGSADKVAFIGKHP